MMNAKKIVLSLLMLLNAEVLMASSPIDGIYNCQFTWGDETKGLMYLTVNSNATTTVISFPNVNGVLIKGYALGPAATATTFNGLTDLGSAVTVTASGELGRKALYIKGTWSTFNSATQKFDSIQSNATCGQLL